MADLNRLTLHPDALFDAPYEDQAIDLAGYRQPEGPWRVEDFPGGVLDAPVATIRAGDARWQVSACGEGVVRMRCAPDGGFGPSVTEQLGLLTVPDGGLVSHPLLDGDEARMVAGSMGVQFNTADGQWRVRRPDGTSLVACVNGGARFGSEAPDFGAGHRFHAAFELPTDQRIFGFGGRIARPDRTGSSADMFAMKVGLYSGDYGGFPIPFFLSTGGYGVFLNNPWPHVYFDMGRTDPTRWQVHAPGGELDLFVIDGPDFATIIRRFTAMVGRIPDPQRWWMGFWVSALAFVSADEVAEVGRRLRAEGYPADAMVIDGPWRGGPDFLKLYMTEGQYPTNDLNWHPAFGDGPAMVARLRELGLKTVLHQNSRSWLPETAEEQVPAGALRREGAETVVRLTHPEGEAFYADALAPRHAEGVGTWWLDHGDRVGGEVSPGVPSRNLFGSLWARSTQQAMARDGLGRQLVLIRGGGIGSQTTALPWPGDTRYGIDFFLEDLWFCMSAGLCGYPVTSADLGGFRPVEIGEPGHNTAFEIENLARRLCQGIVLIPSPRMHQCDSDPPKLPWHCPPQIQDLYRKMLELRYALTPYLFAYACCAAETGAPILRPMVYGFMDDPAAVACDDQCLLGDWLLAAPVVRHGQRQRTVYLPTGRWTNWWTGTRHTGPCRLIVEVPLFEPSGLPLFVRGGAVIPTQPVTPSLADDLPEQLTLHLFPDGHSRFDCPEGGGIRSWFELDQAGGQLTVTIHNAAPRERRFELRLPGSDRTASFTVAAGATDTLVMPPEENDRADDGCTSKT